MSDDLRRIIEECFRMETGLEPVRICRIGYTSYTIEAEDGNTYTFRW